MKLLRNTENKITKDKSGEYVPYLEIKAIIINKSQELCMHLFRINHLVNYARFHQQILYL